MKKAPKEIPPEPHWAFCYYVLPKVSRNYALIIQELDPELREAFCIFYLVLRALDTVEDDTSLAAEVKVPILIAFHDHIYERNWHFSCGRDAYKVLMDEFHHVSAALMELKSSYQEIIKETTKRTGAGMAKYIYAKRSKQLMTMMRLGLKAKIMYQTRTMADVYGAFFDFSSLLKSKSRSNTENLQGI